MRYLTQNEILSVGGGTETNPPTQPPVIVPGGGNDSDWGSDNPSYDYPEPEPEVTYISGFSTIIDDEPYDWFDPWRA